MNEQCRQAREAMALELHGEATAEAAAEWRRHAAACGECGGEARMYQQLGAALEADRDEAGNEAALATQAAALRAELMERLPRRRPAPDWIRRYAVAGAAAALTLLGFFGGWMARAQWRPAATTLAYAAAVESLEPALYRIDNVSGGAASGSASVDIHFATLRQEELDAPVSDPRVEELLVEAVEHPANAGVRLNAIGWLSRVTGRPEAEAMRATVESAMLDALRGDANPGVRLRALQALAPLARAAGGAAEADDAPGLLEALANTGLGDNNSGVRAQAIAALSQAPAAESAPLLRDIGLRSADAAVRLRCEEALERLQAGGGKRPPSVEQQ